MDNLTLTKEIHAPQEIKLDSVEEQKKKFEHQLQKFQGDKKEYFRQRRLKDKDAANSFTFEETTKKVSTGKFSSKTVKGQKMVLNNRRVEKNASDKFRRLTKKVLGNGASLDLQNENLSEKATSLLNSLITYSNMDVVAAQKNQESDEHKQNLQNEGKLAFSLTKDMEAFLSTEATEEEKKILQPHLDRMLTSTRGTLNVGNNPVEDYRGYTSYEKVKEKKKPGFFKMIKNLFSKTDDDTEEEVEKTVKLKMQSREDQALFAHEPSLNDIAQGSIGDCYLLAAIASIVSSDPDSIKSCMKDEGKTVVVRLYHPETQNDQTTMVPHYYRVDKTVPVTKNGNDLYAKGSLWVQMLEKAYVASGIKVANKVKKTEDYKNSHNKNLFYDEISGGQEEETVSHITGKMQDKISFRTVQQTGLSIAKKVFESGEEATQQKEFLKNSTVPEDLLNIIQPSVVPDLVKLLKTVNNKTFLDEYYNFVRTHMTDGFDTSVHANALTILYTTYPKNHINDADYDPNVAGDALASIDMKGVTNMTEIIKSDDETLEKLVTIEAFTNYINKATIDTFPFRSSIKDPVQKTKFLNMLKDKVKEKDGVQKLFGERKVFSGQYDDQANDLFEKIKEGEENNMIMTASAGYFMHNDKSIGLNDEDMDKGLVSTHAYTLLGVETYQDKKFVRVRNPWGSGTRDYMELENRKIDYSAESGDETSGIFAVELNDFMNHFQYISRGEV